MDGIGSVLAQPLSAAVRGAEAAAMAHAADDPSAAPLSPAAGAAQNGAVQASGLQPAAPSTYESRAQADHDAPPFADAGGTLDLALTDAQLAPAVLSSLQVEPSWAWSLPLPPDPERRRARVSLAGHEPASLDRDPRHADAEHDAHDDADAEPDDEPASADAAFELLTDDGAATADAALLAQLHLRFVDDAAPPALRAAADEWRRGRAVVLACPQAQVDGERAWAFVLQPRRPSRSLSALPSPAVRCRVDARLRWSVRPDADARWTLARMVKDHHPRRGRQLLPMHPPAAPRAPLPCRVQLGPVLPEDPRACGVLLRIDAVHRFWPMLDQQWSVHVVICSLPLAAEQPLHSEPSR